MDVVVTCPKDRWEEWLAEGDLPGEPWTGNVYAFSLSGPPPVIQPGERVYVVAHGRLRGYAPLVDMVMHPSVWDGGSHNDYQPSARFSLVRDCGAVAVTLYEETESAQGEAYTRPVVIRGFPGWRYRWWEYEEEVPFPDWKRP